MVRPETLVTVGVVLAVIGAGSVLLDAYQADDGRSRFVGYLIGVLAGVTGLGLVRLVVL